MNHPLSTTRPTAHLPGEAGVWVMIGGDLLIFSLLFGTYLHYQGADPTLFARSQATLNQGIGVLNTLILLTSSWFVARAVVRLRRNPDGTPGTHLLVAVGLGMVFLVDKVVEWTQLVDLGHTLQSNGFYMFFFMLTGIHAIHVAIGCGALIYAWLRLQRVSRAGARDLIAVESSAAFWHLVDLLWVVLFSLLYLVR